MFKKRVLAQSKIRCSFCGRERNMPLVVAGPGVCLCDEGAEICTEVLRNNRETRVLDAGGDEDVVVGESGGEAGEDTPHDQFGVCLSVGDFELVHGAPLRCRRRRRPPRRVCATPPRRHCVETPGRALGARRPHSGLAQSQDRRVLPKEIRERIAQRDQREQREEALPPCGK